MSDYTEFFLASPSSVVQLELLEITHPDFTQAYRVVRNAVDGVTVTLETSATAAFVYYPLRVMPVGVRDTLDFGLKIDLGDLGEVLPLEVDAVTDADGFGTKPTVVYRTYRSDDLTKPLFGPLTLHVTSFSFTREGSTFEAQAPTISVASTGELYKIDRFPMLRGFL